MVLPHVVRNTIAACILANTLPQIVAAVLTVCCIPKWRTGRWCRKGPGVGGKLTKLLFSVSVSTTLTEHTRGYPYSLVWLGRTIC